MRKNLFNVKGENEMIVNEPLEKIFFTADNHFGHSNIIQYTNRPFNSVVEMDRVMINNWNAMIGPDDIVFHLGDFCLGDNDKAKEYFSKLNGLIFILNTHFHHDKYWLPKEISFLEADIYSNFNNGRGGAAVKFLPPIEVLEFEELGDGKHPLVIVLCHYPLAVWDRKHYGSIHLHGHNHGRYIGEGKIMDVGVDCNDFYPVSFNSIFEAMK